MSLILLFFNFKMPGRVLSIIIKSLSINWKPKKMLRFFTIVLGFESVSSGWNCHLKYHFFIFHFKYEVGIVPSDLVCYCYSKAFQNDRTCQVKNSLGTWVKPNCEKLVFRGISLFFERESFSQFVPNPCAQTTPNYSDYCVHFELFIVVVAQQKN